MLDAVAHVVLDFALVIYPRYTERENAVGDAEAFDEVITLKFRVLVVFIFDSRHYLLHSLQVFRLIWKTTFQVVKNFGCFHCNFLSRLINIVVLAAKLYRKYEICNKME